MGEVHRAPRGACLRELQERAARALPAVLVEVVDGWWLRHAPGCSWWVGTVLPHGGGGPGGLDLDDLARRVDGAEGFYADRGEAARFQVTPGACPDGLDAFLHGRGYHRTGPMSLQAAWTAAVRERAPTDPPPGRPRLRARVDEHPTERWFATWHAVHGGGADPGPERDLLAWVGRPSAYAGALVGDEVVAVGRAVVDTGWAGVFGMGTWPGARRSGAARAVLTALADWAASQGADRMYLQVERDNAAALALYARSGFGELCAYHYRTP